MSDIPNIITRIAGIHGKIAKDVLKGGEMQLRCRECGQIMDCGQKRMASYLSKGWPMCCGETMMLEKKP